MSKTATEADDELDIEFRLSEAYTFMNKLLWDAARDIVLLRDENERLLKENAALHKILDNKP